MKMYREMIAPSFLTSTLYGGQWSASHPCCFTPKETAARTHCIEGWVDPKASLDITEKSLFPLPGIEPRLLSLRPLSLAIISSELSISEHKGNEGIMALLRIILIAYLIQYYSRNWKSHE
jgi:hypothetical protein